MIHGHKAAWPRRTELAIIATDASGTDTTARRVRSGHGLKHGQTTAWPNGRKAPWDRTRQVLQPTRPKQTRRHAASEADTADHVPVRPEQTHRTQPLIPIGPSRGTAERQPHAGTTHRQTNTSREAAKHQQHAEQFVIDETRNEHRISRDHA